MNWRTWLALLIGVVLGFGASVSIQSLLDAGARSKAKRSVADAISISRALEAFRDGNGRYPPLDHDLSKLTKYLVPKYIQTLPARDAYDQPYLVVMDGSVPAIVSTGRNGFAIERGQVVAEGPVLPRE